MTDERGREDRGGRYRIAPVLVTLLVGSSLVLACEDGGSVDLVSDRAGVLCEVDGLALTVGGVESADHAFGEVPDVALLPDSGVVAVDRQAKQLHVFDATGELVRTLGREGEGPGELLDPIAVDVVGREIFVWEWRQSRITGYDLSSEEVATHHVPGQLNPKHQFGRRESDFVIGTTTGVLGAAGPGERWTRDLGIVTFDPVTSAVDTIEEVPDQEVVWVDQAGRRTGSPVFSSRADVTASSGILHWSGGDSALVVRVREGRRDTLRWAWPVRRVDRGDFEAYRTALLASRPESMHAMVSLTLEAVPIEDAFPAVQELVPDQDGGIWVHMYAAPLDSTRTYVRLDGEGAVCQVQLPRGFTATEGGRDWLLGVATDELQVPRVERWRLRNRSN